METLGGFMIYHRIPSGGLIPKSPHQGHIGATKAILEVIEVYFVLILGGLNCWGTLKGSFVFTPIYPLCTPEHSSPESVLHDPGAQSG